MATADHTDYLPDSITRHDINLEAAHQVYGLSDMILSELEKLNMAGTSGLKAAVLRVRDLSGVMMRTMNEDDDDYEDMQRILNGYAKELRRG